MSFWVKDKSGLSIVYVAKHQTGRKAIFCIGFVCIKVAVLSLWESGGRNDEMSRRRSRIHVRVPQANENVAMTAGNRILTEAAFRDLKHGIDWRPARCTSINAIKGRILVSFLALFCLSMVRFLYPEFKRKTAESLVEELSSF
jgi:hypothetical protein